MSGSSRRTERIRRLIRVGVYLILFISPLPFASVQPGSVLAIELAAAFLGAGSLLVLASEGLRALPSLSRRLLLVLGAMLLIGLVQLMPLPASWAAWIAGPTQDMRQAVEEVLGAGPQPGVGTSLSSPDTVDALLRLAGCGLLGLAAAVGFTRWRQIVVGLSVAVGSAAFQALYGSLEMLSGRQHIFLYAKKYDTEVATGTFINSNHFGGYLAIVLPVALALTLVYGQRLPQRRGWRERVVRLGDPDTLKFITCALMAALLWGGVFLSTSRGALAAALVGSAALVLLSAGKGRRRWVLIAVLLVPALPLSLQQIRAPREGALLSQGEIETLSGRYPIWRGALRMVPSYAVIGSGYGTFEDAFLMYRPETVHARIDHAHNDWLQLLVEGGAPALCCGLLLLVLVLRHRSTTRSDSVPAGILAAGLRAALLAFAFHALLDFPARIPAIAVLVACLAGLLSAAVSVEGPVRLLGGRLPRQQS